MINFETRKWRKYLITCHTLISATAWELQQFEGLESGKIGHFRYIEIHTWLRGLWGNQAKEMYYSLQTHEMISLVLFPQAS